MRFCTLFVVFIKVFAVITSFSQIFAKTYEMLAADARTVVAAPTVAGMLLVSLLLVTRKSWMPSCLLTK